MPMPIEVSRGDLRIVSPTIAQAATRKSTVVIGCPGMRKYGRAASRIARVAAAEDDQRDGRESEEDVIVAGDVSQDLIVAAREGDGDRGDALQRDRDNRNVRFRVDLGELLEERAVRGHLEVDAGRRKNLIAQEAERRERDDRAPSRAARPCRRRSRRSPRPACLRGREAGDAEDAQACDVHRKVEYDDADDADEDPRGSASCGS